jgi:hypothetical protein
MERQAAFGRTFYPGVCLAWRVLVAATAFPTSVSSTFLSTSASFFDVQASLAGSDNLRLCPSPVTAAEVSVALPFVIASELRISYHAALVNGHVCGFL